MIDLKTAVIKLITQPLERQERKDGLIEDVFHIRTKSECANEIKSFFKLIGSNIKTLSNESVEVIMSHIYYLEIDADPTPPNELIASEIAQGGFVLADRDIKWNEEIALSLIRILREAYAILGPPERDVSPGEIMQQSQAISTYTKVEELELKKKLLESAPTGLLEKQMLEDARK